MSALEGKLAIITGAKGGLGSFITEAFLAAGAKVVGMSRSIQASAFPHPEFVAMPADLSSGQVARKVADDVVAQFGRIDALVHAVGGFADGRCHARQDAGSELPFGVLHRAGSAAAHATPGRRESLAVASRQAAEPGAMVGAYSASKAALIAPIRTIALENTDRGISANTVLPGTMDTPANRAADPEADPLQWVQPVQVAALLVHLASNAGSQVTGAAIPIFGGQV